MSTDIVQPFVFKDYKVRTLTFETGQTWWVLKDVCEVLGIRNATDVAKRLDRDEVTRFNLGGLSGQANIVNETGLYRIVLRSDKPEAREFQRWVTHDVLPSIRRHGAYMSEAVVERTLADPDYLIRLATQLKEDRAARFKAERRLEVQKPKVLFADAVSAAHTDILVGDLAKILKGNGVDTGGTRLFAWMREHGYLMKAGSAKNMPTQRAMELGLFHVKETTVVHADGHTTINKTPKVTGKGQAYFISQFLDDKDMGVAA
ncbi:phage antirepressor KilAC domain-containing protein [Bifidobacterium sp. B4001]|uniref:phage antirepressor KilAC domain-containing protein n=1 Tax=unclassified Bifidobacterium TaxID=2608897 RepID=UPI00226B93B3|nr:MULTISPECIES: phage antirepressor KilAC domain-containing protein [unclassified Bifidobacterium]MCX8672971.1 phage antirepressor KilAC domain-containing protein [Bifidobacterium sp. B4079]MCX8681404.1 phage antirepressor KilAC domain-containing protein [Bifidobacterium sp. B4001]